MRSWRRSFYKIYCPIEYLHTSIADSSLVYRSQGKELHFYNMLSVKPSNDIDEFNHAIERIRREMASTQNPPRTL